MDIETDANQAELLKNQGNEEFRKGNPIKAIEIYTKAISKEKKT
jgi:hypothetical protein